jgi:ribonucleoside-diphosphate reductase alpha chain
MKIKKIVKSQEVIMTGDLEVGNSHSYQLSNGVVSHNSVILGTSSGIHAEHATRYFRIMQLNKESDTAKFLEQHMKFMLEESVYSETKSDYVVFVPIENPKEGLYKKDLSALDHLEKIKLVQENWVDAGTNPELCAYPNISHNVSCTVIVGDDEKEIVSDYIWNNKNVFNAVSFISTFGDKDFNQAPFTSVLTTEEIMETYGKGALFASGMIVDGLHYFKENLWQACESVINKDLPISGTREDVLLKKYWIDRVKKYSKNYFKGDLKLTINCLKDVHLLHKWEVINRQMKEVDFNKILDKPTFKDVSDYSAQACSGPGGSCEITRI